MKRWTLTPWFVIFALIMLAMTMATYVYNPILGYIELGVTVAAFAVVFAVSFGFRGYIKGTVKSAAEHIGGFNAAYLEKFKYPVALAGDKGDILWCNERFKSELCGGKNPEGESIGAFLSGADIKKIADGDGVDCAVSDKEFTVFCVTAGEGYICHFIEDTYYKKEVREYHSNLPCVALVSFDNAEDFSSDSDELYSEVLVTVENTLQRWATEYSALYKKLGNNRYMMIFSESNVEKMIAAKFPILKDIRAVNINNRVATISVGLCRGSKQIKESELNARKALEMALGRGGDQVAVIKNNSYEFFGGTAAASEKVSKVRMRVIANAISRAAADADRVFVMGHRFSDLDCVGAAMGMQCIMEKTFNRNCKIVINKHTSMAKQLITYAESKLENDIFIAPEEALRYITAKTLLIIVDTHIESSLESPAVYEKCKKVIVIDHHRKAVNHIDNALVFCHEPSSSSASEMCCEIIGCLDDKPLGYVQADALLSGITLDTKNFVLKTGVRTFEAAAYLRRKGANTLTVKEMFSGSISTYREKVDIVCRSKIYRGCAISYSDKKGDDVRLAAAQAADEMLTLSGISASFVVFSDSGQINISARSYGRVNVQVIMEKLGGGGHQTMAATQLKDISTEEAVIRLKSAIDGALNEDENT